MRPFLLLSAEFWSFLVALIIGAPIGFSDEDNVRSAWLGPCDAKGVFCANSALISCPQARV